MPTPIGNDTRVQGVARRRLDRGRTRLVQSPRLTSGGLLPNLLQSSDSFPLLTQGARRSATKAILRSRTFTPRFSNGGKTPLLSQGVVRRLQRTQFGGSQLRARSKLPPPKSWQVSITNPGAYTTTKVTYDFTGPFSNPGVTNLNSGDWVVVGLSVPAGQHLVIDCDARTVLLNGVNVITSLTHGGTRWAPLLAGVNQLLFAANLGGGSVQITCIPPY